jgi:hypothetical protein
MDKVYSSLTKVLFSLVLTYENVQNQVHISQT